MAVEFNPDGSIKLPGHIEKAKQENRERMLKQRCIRIKREVVSSSAPKKCALHITLSEAFTSNSFITAIYGYFMQKSVVPTKLIKVNEKEFKVEVGTDFKRCSDCNSFINQLKDFLDGNVIEDMGTCTYKGRESNFCYEDYFE
jgi:hypothetical protein